MDEDQNGVLDMHEFVNLVQDQFASKDNDEDLLQLAFSQIDTTGTGSMSLDDIRRAIEQCKKLVTSDKDEEKLKELLIGSSKKKPYQKNVEQAVVPGLTLYERFKLWVNKKLNDQIDKCMPTCLREEQLAEEAKKREERNSGLKKSGHHHGDSDSKLGRRASTCESNARSLRSEDEGESSRNNTDTEGEGGKSATKSKNRMRKII